MTQDEIIEMARQVGVEIANNAYYPFFIEELESFAKLVAAKEREACEKICADLMGFPVLIGDCHICVGVIRARGEQA